jgi:hypothetical protein
MIEGISSTLSINSTLLCSDQILTNITRHIKFDQLGGAFKYHKFDKMAYCVYNPPNCELINFKKPVAESRQHWGQKKTGSQSWTCQALGCQSSFRIAQSLERHLRLKHICGGLRWYCGESKCEGRS